MDQKERKRGEPLLPIDEEPRSLDCTRDNRAQKIGAIGGNSRALIKFVIVFEEAGCQVIDQLGDVRLGPCELTLVVVESVLATSEQLANGAGRAIDQLDVDEISH